MLIETDPGGKRQIRAHAHEHPAPAWGVDIGFVLHDPALSDLQVPAVRLLLADRRHDPSRLSRLENDDDPIRLCALEIWLDKFVASALWRLDDRSTPFIGLLLDPTLELLGRAAQHVSADRINPAIAAEKADHPLRLLKRLDEPVE